MDEGDSIFLYSGSCSDCYYYVCSSNYCSRWQPTRFRLANLLKWEGFYALYYIWCFVFAFCLNFIVDVSWHPHITLCRGRFPYILTPQNDNRPFIPYLFHSAHDGQLLYLTFHYSTTKIMVGHFCHLPCECSIYPIHMDAISSSYWHGHFNIWIKDLRQESEVWVVSYLWCRVMLEIIIFTLFRKIIDELSSCDGYRIFLFLFLILDFFILN